MRCSQQNTETPVFREIETNMSGSQIVMVVSIFLEKYAWTLDSPVGHISCWNDYSREEPVLLRKEKSIMRFTIWVLFSENLWIDIVFLWMPKLQ